MLWRQHSRGFARTLASVLRGGVVASVLVVAGGCWLLPDDEDASNVKCSGFPEAPADCAKVRYVCPGATGGGLTASDPMPMPGLSWASDQACLLLAPGTYTDEVRSYEGFRAYGAGKDQVIFQNPVLLFGNNDDQPGKGATIQFGGVTFRSELDIAWASKVKLKNVAFQGQELVALFLEHVDTAELEGVTVSGVRLGPDGDSIALAVSDTNLVTATDLTIVDNEGIGLGLVNARAVVQQSRVQGNGLGGVGVICQSGHACTTSPLSFSDTTIEGNRSLGMFVLGGALEMHGVKVTGTLPESNGIGAGLVLGELASLVAEQSSFSSNASIGLLVDGSRAKLSNCIVNDNQGQGIVVQNGMGIAPAPGESWNVELTGAETEVCRNSLMGLEVLSARYIHVADGRFCETQWGTVGSEKQADGIAMLRCNHPACKSTQPTSEVLIENVRLSGNLRAQMIFDKVDGVSGLGILVKNPIIEAQSAGEFGIIRQNNNGLDPTISGEQNLASLPDTSTILLFVMEDPEPLPDVGF